MKVPLEDRPIRCSAMISVRDGERDIDGEKDRGRERDSKRQIMLEERAKKSLL